MIASSFMAKGSALAAALAVHGALVWGLAQSEETPRTVGASAAVETRLGDSFADMTEGVLTPLPASTQALKPVTPTYAAQPAPSTNTAIPAPALTAQPAKPLVAQTVEDTSPTSSRRPEQRPKSLEKQAPKAKPQKPKTGAKKAATKGSTEGRPKATQKPKSTGTAKASTKGNAAASNYPGTVMRKISRVPKPRVGSTGTATVRFTISANGGLASASIARSSGIASLDRAALKVIQRAAPFPKPPAGAQRSFTLKIKGAR
ncbi:energy transducer TonB [Lentibacter sp. XHP0401]|uniref:energy transducer TonB family protein n=1 Tax=Lentibacter sp. XHP0401 TaxID=2984334 RepID=UPI0021E8EAB6|nr:TonB family protein [Lentibacter sp. XHP0401]MCV2893570.1 TonB family protein [Lentibacter sp. XHP0401]